MEPNFSERILEERLQLAEDEIAKIHTYTSRAVDEDAWRRMVAALPEIINIIRVHQIFEDRKSIFALIACYLGYTSASDICMTKGQSWAAYLLIWVIAGSSPKGMYSESKEPKNDPIMAAMKRSVGLVQKYFIRRKGTSPMVVYYHDNLNAAAITRFVPGSSEFVDELRSQLERIPKRDTEKTAKRPASEICEGQSPTKRARYSSESASEVSTPDSNSDLSTDPSPRMDVNQPVQISPSYALNNNYAYPPIAPIVHPSYYHHDSSAEAPIADQQGYTNYSYIPRQNIPDNFDTHVDTYQQYPTQYQSDIIPPQESEMLGDMFHETDVELEHDIFVSWLLSDGDDHQFLNRFEVLTSMYDSIVNEYSPNE